jgi:amino acid transporter
LPFLIAFIVATLTAFSYLELVTKYPQAAGAALYTHKAFGVHFVAFLVAFAVMCSGITSASTASRAFAANFGVMIGVVQEDWMGRAPFEPSDTLTTVLAVHLHLIDRRHQFAGSRRERQDERRADLCRAHRLADRDLRRLLRHNAG